MPYAHTGAIVLANGDTLDVPNIFRESGGYVYIPDVLRKAYPHMWEPNAKTMGRGWDAEKKGKELVDRWVRTYFTENDWPEVRKLARPVNRHSIGNVGYHIGWEHPVWGETWISMEWERLGWTGKGNMSFNVSTHDFAHQWAKQEIVTVFTGGNKTFTIGDRNESTRQDALSYWRKFIEDPYGLVSSIAPPHFDHEVSWQQRLLDQIEPTQGWAALRDLPYRDSHKIPIDSQIVSVEKPDGTVTTDDAPTLWTYATGRATLLDERVFTRTLTSEVESLRMLFKMMEPMGYRINTTERMDPVGEMLVTGWTIEISEVPGVRGREHAHTVRVSVEDGMTVNCGYVEDEERYIEYQKRHAVDTFMEVLNEHQEATREWSQERIGDT